MPYYSAGDNLVKREPLEEHVDMWNPLQDQALVLLATTFPLQQSSAGSVLKHLPDALVSLGRALKVLVSANLLADFLALFDKI